MEQIDFTCTEWIEYANRCSKQCNFCKNIDIVQAKKWIDLEDGNGNNEIN